jgi:hypothetical protein
VFRSFSRVCFDFDHCIHSPRASRGEFPEGVADKALAVKTDEGDAGPKLERAKTCARAYNAGVRWLTMLCLIVALHSDAADMPSLDDVLGFLHIQTAQRADLLKGKILTTDIGEEMDKELAVGVTMFVPVPMNRLVEYVRSGQWFTSDRDVIAFGELKEPVTLDSFPTNAPRAELLRRYEAYRQRGLAGIAPRGKARPAEELQTALNEANLLAKLFPEIYRALQKYPEAQPDDLRHAFFWINQRVENRPTFILAHRSYIVRADSAFMAERQFYVERSYNSLFLLAGVMPMDGGTIMLYSNRTFTDQVTGIGSGLRHSIGRKQMRDTIVKSFEEIRAAVSR